MVTAHKIAIWVIVIEFSLVFLFGIFTFIYKFLNVIGSRSMEKSIVWLINILRKYDLSKDENFSYIKRKYKNLMMLLSVYDRFIPKESDQDILFLKIKERFLVSVILPVAREKINHKNWVDRLLAIKCFSIKCDKNDVPHILNLLSDEVPIVRFEALYAAKQVSDECQIINTIIDRMSEERRKSHQFYINFFSSVNSENYLNHVINRLQHDKNEYVRSVCYKILVVAKYSDCLSYSWHDVQSKNLELAIAAIHFVAQSEKSEAIDQFSKIIERSEWQVRVAIVHALKTMHSEKTVNFLAEILKDKDWWVRINAAMALKSLGLKGIKVLQQQKVINDRYAYEVAQHVLQHD